MSWRRYASHLPLMQCNPSVSHSVILMHRLSPFTLGLTTKSIEIEMKLQLEYSQSSIIDCVTAGMLGVWGEV